MPADRLAPCFRSVSHNHHSGEHLNGADDAIDIATLFGATSGGSSKRPASASPVRKIEANPFGGYDLRQSDGKLVRCEKKASGETECRVVQEGRKTP